jgi:hypothetical protein
MKANLTTIAALPGSGGGCMSALPAEKNEAKKPRPAFMDRPVMKYEEWQRTPEYKAAKDFQWPEKQDEGPMVYVPSLGIFIPAVWPPLFKETGDSA